MAPREPAICIITISTVLIWRPSFWRSNEWFLAQYVKVLLKGVKILLFSSVSSRVSAAHIVTTPQPRPLLLHPCKSRDKSRTLPNRHRAVARIVNKIASAEKIQNPKLVWSCPAAMSMGGGGTLRSFRNRALFRYQPRPTVCQINTVGPTPLSTAVAMTNWSGSSNA